MTTPTSPPPDQLYPKVPPPPAYDQGGMEYRPTGESQIVMTPVLPNFGPHKTQITCPNCNANVVTDVRMKNSLLVWIIFGVMFFLGFFLILPWFLCWIPFCIDSLKDVEHYCPNCHRHLGTHKRMK